MPPDRGHAPLVPVLVPPLVLVFLPALLPALVLLPAVMPVPVGICSCSCALVPTALAVLDRPLVCCRLLDAQRDGAGPTRRASGSR